MSQRVVVACLAFASIAGVACTETESATNLHTSGPPSIEQVRINEDPAGSPRPARVFGYGWYPGVTEDIDHHVDSASATDQNLRIIMGKLLLGNYLQQVQCKQPVRIDFDGQPTTYDIVPEGATPDDIAKCTESTVVQQTCHGDNAICICKLDGGCAGGSIAEGTAVGITDANADGAADQMRFTPGAVGIHCDGNLSSDKIDVPTDLFASYWDPSGFQQAPIVPNVGCDPCYDYLGPAIVLQPIGVGNPATAALPTSSTCHLVFSTDVVDKSNQNVCAAANGRPPDCDNVNLDQCKLDQECTPGDVSNFNFTVEPLSVTIQEFQDGDMGVPRTGQVTVQTHNKVPLDPGSIANITIEEVQAGGGTTIYGAYTVTQPPSNSNIVKITWTAATGLAANTEYIITFKTTFADYYHQGLPAPIVYHFTTGP
jgi:hypothetical protein